MAHLENDTALSSYLEALSNDAQLLLERLCSQPSVVAQDLGMAEIADLIELLLSENDFETQRLYAAGAPPAIYGELRGRSDYTILLYYDVQPPEPLELWHTPPFFSRSTPLCRSAWSLSPHQTIPFIGEVANYFDFQSHTEVFVLVEFQGIGHIRNDLGRNQTDFSHPCEEFLERGRVTGDPANSCKHSLLNCACFVIADEGQTAEKGTKILWVTRTEGNHPKVAHTLLGEWLIPPRFRSRHRIPTVYLARRDPTSQSCFNFALACGPPSSRRVPSASMNATVWPVFWSWILYVVLSTCIELTFRLHWKATKPTC